MSVARAAVQARAASDSSRHDQMPDGYAAERLATDLLSGHLEELGGGWRVDDVSFPCSRTFEVDFTVRRRWPPAATRADSTPRTS